MAWTSPITAISGQQFTAAMFNTYIRDNLNETEAAVATGTSGFIVANGTNTLIQRSVATASVVTSESTASTSYTNLATNGPAVTLTTGIRAVIFINARMRNSTAPNSVWAGVNITGASTIAPSDTTSIQFNANAGATETRIGSFFVRPDLTSGSNTFTMQYRVSAGNGAFARRAICVWAF